MLREGKDKEGNVKYSAVTGSTGYRWLEAEMVDELGKIGDIDETYYKVLVDAAVETISKYGDIEWFISDDPYIPPMIVDGKPVYECDLPWKE